MYVCMYMYVYVCSWAGARAQTRMVRDRFISVQHSCGLRRHLDSVPPETAIRQIDRCRVWESHSEQKRGLPPGTNAQLEHLVVPSDSRESAFFTEDSHRTVVSPEVEPQTQLPVTSVVGAGQAEGPEVGNVLTQFVSREGLSSLVARLVQVVQHDNPVVWEAPPADGVPCKRVVSTPDISTQGRVSEPTEQAMVCFSCARPGHGVRRCSRVDTLFPFLPPGWSVAFRDGQYRTVWPGGPHGTFPVGKRGMVRAGGSASRIIDNQKNADHSGVERVDPTTGKPPAWVLPGESPRGSGWSPNVQAFPPLGSQPTVHSPGSIGREYGSDVSSGSAIPGADGPGCHELSDCVKWGLAIIRYFGSWSLAGCERNATCWAK